LAPKLRDTIGESQKETFKVCLSRYQAGGVVIYPPNTGTRTINPEEIIIKEASYAWNITIAY